MRSHFHYLAYVWSLLILSINLGRPLSHAFLHTYNTKRTEKQYSSQKLSSSSQVNNKNLIVFGNGNVGKEVIKHLKSNYNEDLNHPSSFFHNIYCTCRKTKSNTSKYNDFIDGIHYIDIKDTPNYISNCTHMLITIPPQQQQIDKYGENSSSNNDKKNYIDVVLDNPKIMNKLPNKMIIGYVSTTGVYGDHNNAWVDETSDTLCNKSTKAYSYLEIENRWLQTSTVAINDYNRKVFIYRCSGLYGENMSALHTILKNGLKPQTIMKTSSNNNNKEEQQESFTSRIHLKDVANFITITFTKNDDALESGIYNLADCMPASRSVVMEYAYKLLCDANVSFKIPSLQDKNIIENENLSASSSERRSRRKLDRKRVSNKKIQSVLAMNCNNGDGDNGNGLLFPTFREGLPNVLDTNIEKWRENE